VKENKQIGAVCKYFENRIGKMYYEVHGRDDAPAILFSSPRRKAYRINSG